MHCFLYLLIIHRAYFLSAKRSMSDKTMHFIKKMYVHIILKLVKQSYSQTDSADRLCLDTHKIGPLRETHTHSYTQSDRGKIRDQMYTDSSVQAVLLTSLLASGPEEETSGN